MSTTDDTQSTSTPDATLDPAMLAEVEQALDAVHGGGVARPNGGIGHAETVEPTDVVRTETGGIGHPEDPQPGQGGQPGLTVQPVSGLQPGRSVQAEGGIGHPEGPKPDGVARPNGGIGHAETVRP
ncbi:hypothetical protein [Kutzneria sp. CA-103260]|uniref:hypothetical protein n=1 Tax=Kutzneria sp. CA-103260 TaxID=2802641 RepID=UPI001BAB93D9|nr:hypothetical protein [Kutzneria sp. CA-103260]QUQ69525.1 hypothetical protein JJ691_72830 [Kutzneria sp. CA-103260]